MKTRSLKSLTRAPLYAAAAAALLAASAAQADPEAGKITLSAYYTAGVAGELLAAGDYTGVIDELAPHAAAFANDEVAASTNLCVAYVAAGRLDEAHDACNDAVQIVQLDRPGTTLYERQMHKEALAIAYANRAALNRLDGE